MSSTEKLPDLLRVGEATHILDIGRPQLQKLFPHLHILALPRGNRRFPLPYIATLWSYLQQHDKPVHVRPVRDFATTNLARHAIAHAEADLATTLAGHTEEDYISARNLARDLNLGRMTVNDWAERGELSAIYDAGGHRHMQVTAGSLQTLYSWQYPEAIRDNYPSPE